MPSASAAFKSLALNATDTLLSKVDLNSADPGATGASALGSKQSAGTWTTSSGGSSRTNGTAMSWTTGGVTAYGYFSTWDSAGTANGINGTLSSSVTAVTITAAIGALAAAAA
jgi:hypothetical protein